MPRLAQQALSLGEGAGEALATVNMVDPDGRKWKRKRDRKIAANIKKHAERDLNKVQDKIIELGKESTNKEQQLEIDELNKRKELLSNFIKGIDKLEESKTTSYTFYNQGCNISGIAVANKKRGYLNKNNNGEIEIKYIENKSNIYHETQHAIQYEEGKLKIFKDQYFNTPREAKLKNELEAYQIEYIIGNKFNEVYGINNLNDITIEWIITVGY